jgi:uncharacterized protein YejL (UPF0352 family)
MMDDEDNEFFQMEQFTDDELNFFKKVGGFLKSNGPTLLKIGSKIAGFEDEELFNLDKFLDDAVKTVKDVEKKPKNYGDILNDVISVVKDIKQHDDFEDDSLFTLGNLVKDGLNIAKDIKTHNYKDLVGHGAQTVKDVTGKKFLGF